MSGEEDRVNIMSKRPARSSLNLQRVKEERRDDVSPTTMLITQEPEEQVAQQWGMLLISYGLKSFVIT